MADYYCEHNADELIVFDMSEGDAEHDAALDIIKEICTRAEVDGPPEKNTQRRQLDALLDGMSDTGIRIVSATAKEIAEVETEGR